MFTIEKRYAKPNLPRTIRFTERIYNQLLIISEQEGISLNNLVLQCCTYAIENYHGHSKEKEMKE